MNLLKGGGWPPDKDELMMTKSPMRRKFPWPEEATDRARWHIFGMCTSKAWERGGEGERERKLWFQIPSQDIFFFIVSVLLSKIKREGEREGSEKRKQNPYWSAVLFSVLWAVTRNIHRASMWEPWKVKREKTPWVFKEHFLLIMHQGGSKAHKLHIQN